MLAHMHAYMCTSTYTKTHMTPGHKNQFRHSATHRQDMQTDQKTQTEDRQVQRQTGRQELTLYTKNDGVGIFHVGGTDAFDGILGIRGHHICHRLNRTMHNELCLSLSEQNNAQ